MVGQVRLVVIGLGIERLTFSVARCHGPRRIYCLLCWANLGWVQALGLGFVLRSSCDCSEILRISVTGLEVIPCQDQQRIAADEGSFEKFRGLVDEKWRTPPLQQGRPRR